jgi:hypothetical protein
MPRRRRHANFSQLTPFERGRIVGRFVKVVFLFAKVSKRVGWKLGEHGMKNTVHVVLKALGLAEEPHHERIVFFELWPSERGWYAVADQWYAAVGSPIHMRIVYHRVRSMGLTSYCPRLVLPLTSGMVQRM